jgi:hypothetical protein
MLFACCLLVALLIEHCRRDGYTAEIYNVNYRLRDLQLYPVLQPIPYEVRRNPLDFMRRENVFPLKKPDSSKGKVTNEWASKDGKSLWLYQAIRTPAVPEPSLVTLFSLPCLFFVFYRRRN